MTEQRQYLRTFRSLGNLNCPRCHIGLREAPTGPQCWKCLGNVGIKTCPTEYSPVLTPCPVCQAKMLYAEEDLVCPDCFHVVFGAGNEALLTTLFALEPCLSRGSKIVLFCGEFVCAKDAKLTCLACGGILDSSANDLVCTRCGFSVGST